MSARHSQTVFDTDDLDGAFANLARVVRVARWLAVSEIRRVAGAEKPQAFQMSEEAAEQLLALLEVAAGYGEGMMAVRDGRVPE